MDMEVPVHEMDGSSDTSGNKSVSGCVLIVQVL